MTSRRDDQEEEYCFQCT